MTLLDKIPLDKGKKYSDQFHNLLHLLKEGYLTLLLKVKMFQRV